MKKQLIFGFTIALFAILLVSAGLSTAAESDYTDYRIDQKIVITGFVEQEGDAFILQATDGDQYTMAGQDLSNMIGKKVQATGQLIREQNENKFNVSKVLELPDEEMTLDKTPAAPIALE